MSKLYQGTESSAGVISVLELVSMTTLEKLVDPRGNQTDLGSLDATAV